MKSKKEQQIAGDYIAWHELNGVYGRVLTLMEAIGAIPENDTYVMTSTSFEGQVKPQGSRRQAIKDLLSAAIFYHQYEDHMLFLEGDLEKAKKLCYNVVK